MTNFRSETGYTKAAPIVAEQVAAASAPTVSISSAVEASAPPPLESKPEELKEEIKEEERDEPELILEVVFSVEFSKLKLLTASVLIAGRRIQRGNRELTNSG